MGKPSQIGGGPRGARVLGHYDGSREQRAPKELRRKWGAGLLRWPLQHSKAEFQPVQEVFHMKGVS
jgi:hypothetical protein